MLNLPGHRGCNCDGPTRRELLRIGSIGMMSLSLPHFFFWRAQASAASKYAGARGWESAKNVVMIFLQEDHHHVLRRLPASSTGVFAAGAGLGAPEEEMRKTQ